MKLNKHYFTDNLDSCSWMQCDSLLGLAWLMMVGAISYINSSNFHKVKLMRVLNKINITCMVIKVSCTTSRPTNCPSSSFNSIGVKYFQISMHAIVAYIVIWCFASILSNNSLLLFEELESRFKFLFLIGLPPKKMKMKWCLKTLQEIIVKWITNSKKVKWKGNHNALDQPKGKWDGIAFEKIKKKWSLYIPILN